MKLVAELIPHPVLENYKDYFNYFAIQSHVFQNIFAKADYKCLCI